MAWRFSAAELRKGLMRLRPYHRGHFFTAWGGAFSPSVAAATDRAWFTQGAVPSDRDPELGAYFVLRAAMGVATERLARRAAVTSAAALGVLLLRGANR